jgi:hypothetical protein
MAGIGSTYFDASKGLAAVQISETKWVVYNLKNACASFDCPCF